MDEAEALFTGDYSLNFPAGYSKEADILVVQDKPVPLVLLSLAFDMEVTEE